MTGGLSSSRHARQPQPRPPRPSSPLTIIPAGASLNYPPPPLPYQPSLPPPSATSQYPPSFPPPHSTYQSQNQHQPEYPPQPPPPPHYAPHHQPPTSHAPLLPLQPPKPNTLLAAHELSRYTKIVRRLKWKLPFLSTAYAQAIDRVGRDTPSVKETELMFKLDFFEYYMLLERALVHLQAVFGIVIGRGGLGGRGGGGGGLAGSLHGGGGGGLGEGGGGVYAHRYHANVLSALDKTDNPLHEVLGTGEVRKQLGRAKDLRNRWKMAGEEEEEGQGNGEGTSVVRRGNMMLPRKVAGPLESYDLERILKAIFEGFDAAYLVAERYVKGGDEGTLDLTDAEMTISEEEQWEFMVDAMDWEAV